MNYTTFSCDKNTVPKICTSSTAFMSEDTLTFFSQHKCTPLSISPVNMCIWSESTIYQNIRAVESEDTSSTKYPAYWMTKKLGAMGEGEVNEEEEVGEGEEAEEEKET